MENVQKTVREVNISKEANTILPCTWIALPKHQYLSFTIMSGVYQNLDLY